MLIEAPILLGLAMLTFFRSAVWGDPEALWQDTAAKSPHKVRPRFQLAYADYERHQCGPASENYEIASRLAPPDYTLLVDWALALDCAGRPDEALAKLQLAVNQEYNAQAWALIGMVNAKQHRNDAALAALDQAQKINPGFEMTYFYRGNVYATMGNFDAAAQQYQRALDLNPGFDDARQAIERLRNR